MTQQEDVATSAPPEAAEAADAAAEEAAEEAAEDDERETGFKQTFLRFSFTPFLRVITIEYHCLSHQSLLKWSWTTQFISETNPKSNQKPVALL